MHKAVTIIGMGDDGCRGLSSRAVNAVAQAQVLVGGQRHLDFFPQFTGQQILWRGGIAEALERIAEASAENNVCVLASGDPLFFGIGARVIARIGAEHVEVLPQPSAMQWAFAKVGLAWDDAALAVGPRPVAEKGLVTRLRGHAKAACFTDPENSPARLAAHMLEFGQSGWRAWVCENLGGTDERVRPFELADLARCDDVSPLSVLILQRTDAAWRPPPDPLSCPRNSLPGGCPGRG